ncbi:MAG: heme NO-binding domain-containing protein [Vulcanimicrobiota bacterium]
MKGIVFTEFLEMVEEKMGADTADQILDECELESGGVYTSLGTYDHQEMVRMVVKLSEISSTPVPDLLKVFGHHLMGRFAVAYPTFFEGATSSFDVLNRVEDYIHVEVRKLYPDAELPSFAIERPAPDKLIMTYKSSRPFADLAEGLIKGCVDHFSENIQIARHNLDEDNTSSRFELTRA